MKTKKAFLAGALSILVIAISAVTFQAQAAEKVPFANAKETIRGAVASKGVVPSAAPGGRSQGSQSTTLRLSLGDIAIDSGELDRRVAAIRNSPGKLSDKVRQFSGLAPAGLNYEGDLQRTPQGLALTIRSGEIAINANAWQTVIAGGVGVLLLMVVEAACTAYLPAAASVCGAIGGSIGELVKNIIIMAIDGTLTSPKEWGNTIVNTIYAAIPGVTYVKSGADKFVKEALPSLLGKLATSLRGIAGELGSFFGVVKAACLRTADFLAELAPFVRDAAMRVGQLPLAPGGPTGLDGPGNRRLF